MRKVFVLVALAVAFLVFAPAAFAGEESETAVPYYPVHPYYAPELTVSVDPSGEFTTVAYPTKWQFVSVQRHGLPLYLDTMDIRASKRLAIELNKESERLSKSYTVTFKKPDGVITLTLTFPGDTVLFVPVQ